ncbi:hypothetical protein Pyn_12005 [Prunus yedoensis var. nudiflora]|uniref:Uncharacterized protein n=1 Tax=Prunus yedoensis var. nudiflora TaxID=2094558 RepID=A0A314YNW2_PRUYE|nr:hypothetical protein Pyn_12005 [Prunus yedoensis var. nudiflora]
MKARQRIFFVLEKTIEETTPVLAACSVLILLLAFTGYILTEDVTDQENFNNVKHSLNEIERYASEI